MPPGPQKRAAMRTNGVRPRTTDVQIRAASVAHHDLMADMRFLTVCKSRTSAERKMFLD
jgi:hypothetical protein